MRFTFIHAADLHIDSPLDALGGKDAAVAERFAKAGRKAVASLVDETIAAQAAFLIIAGDVFDGDWRDYATGLFMVGQMARLARAGIPVVIIRGNHDAESIVSRNLPDPPGVMVFGGRKASTHVLEQHRVALHGRSFPAREPPAGFVASYPAARPGYLNIGILHTALDGASGDHAAYAPCTVPQLAAFGYDYWALGHIHAAAIVARDPWIVYCGNIQGRSVRETGAKGAMRVTVEDGRILGAEPLVLDAARWAHEHVDIGGCASEHDLIARVEERFALVHASAGGRPLALRLTLQGVCALHARLSSRRESLVEELRALALRLADDFWVERLVIDTQAPAIAAASPGADMLDIAALVAASASAAGFPDTAAQLTRLLAQKLPHDLREASASEDAVFLARLVAQARDLLLGRMDIGGAEQP